MGIVWVNLPCPMQRKSTGVTSGWIYTIAGPLASGKGWLDTYYLEMVPTDQINLNPEITQNPGWNELFGL